MVKAGSVASRIEWVDIARGMAIILMVAGHSSIPEALSKYIWSFHMPLFFVVSGLFYNPTKYGNFKSFLKKKIHTLFIPYWVFSIIVFLAYFGTEYFKPKEMYEGWQGYALWFVPVLFCAELAFYPISRLKNWWIIATIICTTSIGYALSVNDIALPFKGDVIPFALFFIAVGFLFKKAIFTYKPKLLTVALIGMTTIILSQVLPKLGMGRNEYGCIIPNLGNALLGVYFIFSISKYLSKYSRLLSIKFIDYFGRNSLYVMAFSQVFNYWILTFLSSIGIAASLGMIVRYILLFGAIYVTSKLLPKYIPFAVGK